MPSKRLDIKIRILLFLLCTIGILYIAMRLFYQVDTEGFQVVSQDNCVLDNNFQGSGKRVWECPTYTASIQLLTDTSITLSDTDSVCYLTPNPDYPTSNYYTCYQRPSGSNFNPSDGVYYPTSAVSPPDQTPGAIIGDMNQLCSDYKTEGAKIFYGISTSKIVQDQITTASDDILHATNTLSNLSTQYCPKGVTNPKIVDFCKTLNTGIGIYKSLPLTTDPAHPGLNDISTSISNSMLNLINLSTITMTSGYNGFNC